MIIFKVDIQGMAFRKPEGNAPVGSDGNTPRAFPVAFQLM